MKLTKSILWSIRGMSSSQKAEDLGGDGYTEVSLCLAVAVSQRSTGKFSSQCDHNRGSASSVIIPNISEGAV